MQTALSNSSALLATVIMAVITFLLRAAPFWIFARNARQVPPVVAYLGRVLPNATMVMLVVYCLRSVSIVVPASVIPTIVGVAIVVILQFWKKNSILSVFLGTAAYMLCLRLIP